MKGAARILNNVLIAPRSDLCSANIIYNECTEGRTNQTVKVALLLKKGKNNVEPIIIRKKFTDFVNRLCKAIHVKFF